MNADLFFRKFFIITLPIPPLVLVSDVYTSLISIIGLITLLIASALISGSEVALFGLSAQDIQWLKAQESQSSERVLRLLDTPKKLLATILIANNAVNIAIVLLFTSISDRWFAASEYFLLDRIPLQTLIDIAIATALILIFGEILPKIYANRNAASFSVRISLVLTVLDRLFSVLSVPMQNSTVWLENRLSKRTSSISVDHLSQALELASDSDTSNEEKRILEGIVTFGNTDTKQVMRPRIDIFAIAHDAPFQEVINEVTTKGYSRVPVYQESIDKVIGVLFLKDLLPHLDAEKFDWISLIREPFFVPENKKLDDLLLDFKSQKTHLAVVVDEYGGTSGIVTIEDVIEEIVGDISDEFDDVDLIYSKIDDRTYVFEAKTSLKDFYKAIQIEDPSVFEQHKGESETLAGFVLEITKGFPKLGENIRFRGFVFIVESLDNRRLKQLKIKLPAQN